LIDIEDMVVQTVVLEEPLIKKCKECLEKDQTDDSEYVNDEYLGNEDLDFFEGKENVRFIK
jgi:hypothetical protein